MHSATFLAEVQNGLIRTGQPLVAFEGKQVYVTLIAVEAPPSLERNNPASSTPVTGPQASEVAEFLDDVGRIRLPLSERTMVHLKVVDKGRMPMPTYLSDLED